MCRTSCGSSLPALTPPSTLISSIDCELFGAHFVFSMRSIGINVCSTSLASCVASDMFAICARIRKDQLRRHLTVHHENQNKNKSAIANESSKCRPYDFAIRFNLDVVLMAKCLFDFQPKCTLNVEPLLTFSTCQIHFAPLYSTFNRFSVT